MEKRVVLLTGCTSGLGEILLVRLIEEDLQRHSGHSTLRFVVCARNLSRAQSMVDRIHTTHSLGIEICLVNMDISSPPSILKACEEIRVKYPQIHAVYLNAGILMIDQLKISNLFTHNMMDIFTSGGNMVTQRVGLVIEEKENKQKKTVSLKDSNQMDNAVNSKEGDTDMVSASPMNPLGLVFTSNVFGHYLLLRNVEDCLKRAVQYDPNTDTVVEPVRIIWTSSSTADPAYLDLTDIQHLKGPKPYESSKYCVDLVSLYLNDTLNSSGIYSLIACPGFVLTPMTMAAIPTPIWYLALPFFYMLRLFIPNLSVSKHQGTTSLVNLFYRKIENIQFEKWQSWWGIRGGYEHAIRQRLQTKWKKQRGIPNHALQERASETDLSSSDGDLQRHTSYPPPLDPTVYKTANDYLQQYGYSLECERVLATYIVGFLDQLCEKCIQPTSKL